MQFRRSGQRDQRRRKVLQGDPSAEADGAPVPTNTNKTGKSDAIAKAYAAAAVEETETRIADLIPTRPLGLCVLFLLGLTAIAAVQALYTYTSDWGEVLGGDAVAAFDLAQRGGLNAWLSSLLLGVAATVSALIYLIRRHKMDDYRGRYRLWLWAAAGLVLASINAVAGLHGAFDALVVHLAGRALLAHAAGWSLIGISLVGSVLGLRMLFDMWRSRGSSAAFLLAGMTYAGAAALVVLRPLPAGAMFTTMLTSLTLSVAHLMLALALLVYARRVLLEARGVLKVKKKVPKAKPQAKQKSEPSATRQGKKTSDRKMKFDPPHRSGGDRPQRDEQPANRGAPNSASTSSTAETAHQAEADKHGPAEGSPEWNRLSKSQRRRIKKLRRRKTAAAAA